MSARRAYSHDGSDGAYSDDFISDDDRRTHSPYNNRRYGGGEGGLGAHSRDPTDMTLTTAGSDSRYWSSSFLVRAKGGSVQRGRGRGKARRGGRGNSRASEPISMKHDTVTKRVLSASRNRINELRNQVEEQKQIIRDLEAENKLFKKLQFRQEKAIKHFEDKENDLPRILDKHNNEVRVMKEQNRRLREKFDRTDHYLRDAEDELERVKKRMNKYKDMCEQKELMERDELSRKVTKAEIDMEEKDVKIKELERHMEILKKNHRHELGIELARQKDLKRQIEEMTNKNSEVENQLREKSKQLEYKNIYSQSITLNTQDNASVDQSPSRKMKKRASLTDLTPRDKAKFYEEKRREEVRKQKEVKAVQDKKKRQKWEKEEKERADKEKEREKERAPSESPRHAAPEFNFISIDKSLDERERELSSRRRYKEEQDEYRRQSERDRQDLFEKKKELERRQEDDRWKRDNEDREQRQREDREREERDRKQREDREQQDRERREREDRERREQEEERQRKERVERERREKERVEQEKRIQQEKEKLDNDPALREERRKKDELLRKLQDMDKIGNNPLPKKDPESFNSKENTTGYDTPGSKKSDPKEYSFTNPVLNLHKGKPARDDVTVPYIQRQRQKASKDEDEFGYTPSFGPGRGGGAVGGSNKTSTKRLSLFDDDDSPSTLKFDTSSNTKTVSKNPEKSSNLLENLFGPNASSTTNNANSNKLSKGQDSETFFVTGNSPTRDTKRMNGTTTTSAFPWDNNTSSSPMKSNTSRSTHDRGGSTIFGGGAAVVDDDLPPSSNRALPRRARQSNVSTFSAKPSVTAVDPFDDEIEEVVL